MDPRYPVGKFSLPESISESDRAGWIAEIEAAPAEYRAAAASLNEAQLDTPYREGGWTARQVIHHVADSHMNAYGRYKLALTADNPLVWAYDEAEWAELVDSRTAPAEVSLSLLEALHRRWAMVLRAMKPADFDRTYQHPELGPLKLGAVLGLYAWHSRHHLAHLELVRAATAA